MADYYPLIARAVAGLEKNTGEGRRVLYERARQALVTQLRGVTPALSESDVTRERLALEEAIRKVEAESARQTSIRADLLGKIRRPEFPRWEEPAPEPEPAPPSSPLRASVIRSDARARGEPRHDEPVEDAPEAPAEAEEQLPPRRPVAAPQPDARQGTPAPAFRVRPEVRPVGLGGEPSIPPERTEPSRQARTRPSAERPGGEGAPGAGPGRRSALSSGMRDFREVVSEAEELGGASARANRSAREQLAAVPSSAPEPRPPAGPRDADDAFPVIEDTADPEMLEPTFVVDESRPIPPRSRPAPSPRIDRETPVRRTWALADVMRIVSAAVILGGLLAVLFWQWPNMVGLYRALWAPAPETVKEAPAPASKAKIADRIEPGSQPGQPGQPSQAAVSPAAPAVAQRVVLYEEDPSDQKGKQSVGSAVWRTETISPGPGRPPEVAVRGDIEIPERKISMTWTLRRDTDQNRSTSHTIELTFKLPPNDPSGGISSVPGIWMKQAEQTQGTALAALAVRVTAGYFLIGLSAAPADRDRNIQLLKDRQWLDIAIVYNNSKRAILTIEKGTPGERAFAEGFAAWEK
jgi:hypothetical protein